MVNTPQGNLGSAQPTTTHAATTLQQKVQGKISRRGFIFGTGAAVAAGIAWHGAIQFDPSADIASLHTTLISEIARLRETIQSKIRSDFASIITRATSIHDTATKLAQLDNVSGAFTGMTGKGAFVKSMSSIQDAMKKVVSAIKTCEKTTQITNAQPLSTGVGIEELSVIIKEIIPVTALAKTTETTVGQLQIRDFTQNPSGVTPEQWTAFRKYHGDLSLEIYKLLLEIQSLQHYAEEMQQELQYRQDAIPAREAQKRRNLLEEWALFHLLAGGVTALVAWLANDHLKNPPTKSAWDQ